MDSCNHIGWFNISGDENLYLHYAHRTARVIQEMTNPEGQYPSLAFFLGQRSKDLALREIFPNNNIRRGRHNGIINLRLDSSTISSDIPLLFADSDPLVPVPRRFGSATCHEDMTLAINWHPPQNKLFAFYARLVAVFSSVICIFADDIGGLGAVASFLDQWIRYGNPSSLPSSTRPRVIIVVSDEGAVATYDILAIDDLRERLPQDRADIFSSISIFHLAGDHISSLARHRRLKEILLTEIEAVRIERTESRVQFSAIHFEAFFRRSIEHMARSITEPFDFIQSTRIDNEVSSDFQGHLSNFLTSGKDCYLSYDSLVSFIASSILMDAYPPRMHSESSPVQVILYAYFEEFDPISVYESLYKEHCLIAFEKFFVSLPFSQDLCTRIEEIMELLFPAIDLDFESSAQLHRNNLRSFSMHWNQIESHRTCLFCLRRKPEYILTCEHAICDFCVMKFGHPVNGKDSHFEVRACILCFTKGKLITKLKPPTAGARILSIDGGGVRGVVPLEFLGLLQSLLEPELSVQDLFDQAFGTSSGTSFVF